MPATQGLFESFDNLDQIPPEAIARWIKPAPQLVLLENYLANRILYPQALSLTEYDMRIDLAILREALRMHSPRPVAQRTNALLGDSPFLNVTLRKILIPKRFLNFVPDIASLTWAFVDAFLIERRKEDYFSDLWTLVLTDDSDEIIGSLILPQFNRLGEIKISLSGKSYQVKQGSALVLPCLANRCELSYKVQNGSVLGKAESAIEVYGGRLGLVIDGRSL